MLIGFQGNQGISKQIKEVFQYISNLLIHDKIPYQNYQIKQMRPYKEEPVSAESLPLIIKRNLIQNTISSLITYFSLLYLLQIRIDSINLQQQIKFNNRNFMSSQQSLDFILEELPRRPYHKVTAEEKILLIREVMENLRSISKAAKRIGINLSTAKMVMRNHRKTLEEQRIAEPDEINDQSQRLRNQCQTLPGTPCMQYFYYIPSVQPIFDYYGQMFYVWNVQDQ